MKKMMFCGLALALMATVVVAAEGRALRSAVSTAIAPTLLTQSSSIPSALPLSPTPDPLYSPTNQYVDPGMSGYPAVGQPLTLFADVRYHGSRNIAPCAVPTIIQVPDPCNKDKCCKSCVNVEVCVPPCDPKKVCVTRDGNKVRYDFGKYAVVVKTVGDHVVVHYWD